MQSAGVVDYAIVRDLRKIFLDYKHSWRCFRLLTERTGFDSLMVHQFRYIEVLSQLYILAEYLRYKRASHFREEDVGVHCPTSAPI